ncbi:MAG: trypsin-like peptidase domain-containing protein [Chloroflexota bacterium]|nr:trypsin-like peptidase domain-containing protein [Chloroflexota bacterium]
MNSPSATSQAHVVVGDSRYPIPPHGLRIGRAPDNDVVLPDPNVSRQHLVIWATPRGAFLRDLGSQNGTFIGSRRVGKGPEVIPRGARLRVGTTEMLVDGRGSGAAGGPSARSPRQIVLLVAGVFAAVISVLWASGFVAVQVVSDGTSAAGVKPTAAPVVTSAAQGVAAIGSAGPTVATTPAVTPPAAAAAGINVPESAPTAIARTGGRDPGLVRALNASVRVVVPLGSQRQASIGSGTVVSTRGHVLTNYHVVVDELTGRLVNGGADVTIAVPERESEPAQPKYRARVVEADPQLDLALLRIDRLLDGRPAPPDLGLTPVPVGNSDTVQIGDTLTIIGYPGLGGSSLTVTRGIMSGTYRLPNDPGTFIKTDTEISPGNSGGTAINAEGELIGIPTAGRFTRDTVGKLGLLRPVNQAKALIDKANQDR